MSQCIPPPPPCLNPGYLITSLVPGEWVIWLLTTVLPREVGNLNQKCQVTCNQQNMSSLGGADHYIGLIMRWEYEQACLKKVKCQAPWSSVFRLWLSQFQEYPFLLGICRALLSIFGKAANGPWWGRAIHTKPHGVALKSVQITGP